MQQAIHVEWDWKLIYLSPLARFSISRRYALGQERCPDLVARLDQLSGRLPHKGLIERNAGAFRESLMQVCAKRA
ncbi:MAG: hypothetical protein ABSG53_08765 [Thermoguttaceae bacterium]|jgi:hypothetical protein